MISGTGSCWFLFINGTEEPASPLSIVATGVVGSGYAFSSIGGYGLFSILELKRGSTIEQFRVVVGGCVVRRSRLETRRGI